MWTPKNANIYVVYTKIHNNTITKTKKKHEDKGINSNLIADLHFKY